MAPKNALAFKPECDVQMQWHTDPAPHVRLDESEFGMTIMAYTRMPKCESTVR